MPGPEIPGAGKGERPLVSPPQGWKDFPGPGRGPQVKAWAGLLPATSRPYLSGKLAAWHSSGVRQAPASPIQI